MNPLSLNDCINNILTYQQETDKTIKNLVNRNGDLIKVIATIRTNLERCFKRPSDLNHAVYECIDLCRANFVYMDYSSGKTKQDPPLTEIEKILPQYNYDS